MGLYIAKKAKIAPELLKTLHFYTVSTGFPQFFPLKMWDISGGFQQFGIFCGGRNFRGNLKKICNILQMGIFLSEKIYNTL